jgi:hypothetical protein
MLFKKQAELTGDSLLLSQEELRQIQQFTQHSRLLKIE